MKYVLMIHNVHCVSVCVCVKTPELHMEVECLLDGRQFSQLSGFIESQVSM